MKKTLFITVASLLLSVGAFAQGFGPGGQMPDQETMIKMRTERMARELGLDEAQQAKVLELNQKYPNMMMMGRPGMGGPGGPGMGRPPRGEQRPDENVNPDENQDTKAADKKSKKKDKKNKKNKTDDQAAEGEPQARPERPEGGRPGGRFQMSEEQIKQMQETREAYEAELKEILNEDQFKTWKENQNRRPQGGRPGGFGPGGPGGFGPGGPGGFGGGDF